MKLAGYTINDDDLAHILAQINWDENVYPAYENCFKALELTPLKNVKVVVLGQDPYHGENQAHGLSFSVPDGVKIPPSLKNIYKEISAECNGEMPSHGCLESWAKQGVLLLNSALSVAAGQAGSHAKLGWHKVTDALLAEISENCENVVFLLWGKHAQMKEGLIDSKNHLILKSPHPSPLSAHRGFLGNGHFKAANDYLTRHGKKAIDWQSV